MNFFNLMELIHKFMGEVGNLMGHVGNFMGHVGNFMGQTGNFMGHVGNFMGHVGIFMGQTVNPKGQDGTSFSLCDNIVPRELDFCSMVIIMHFG